MWPENSTDANTPDTLMDDLYSCQVEITHENPITQQRTEKVGDELRPRRRFEVTWADLTYSVSFHFVVQLHAYSLHNPSLK